MPKENLALIGVPIDCTGNAGGCDRAPWVFRKLGVQAAIGASHDFNDLSVRIDSKQRDKRSGVIGADSVVRVNTETREKVETTLRKGLTPIMLGGCCSYLMGALAAARRVFGKVGLAYLDGHMDLYDGTTSPDGECADMPMAFIFGKGPAILNDVFGQAFAPGDVSLVGYRDRYLAEPQGSILPEYFGPDFHQLDADGLRARGMKSVATDILAHQASDGKRFWLHLDWDILDEKILPSADYLMPGGLTLQEMVDLVRPLVQSPYMVGMSTACYNPDNDTDLRDGKKLVRAMGNIFQ